MPSPPPARYVARDDLLIYFEFEGFDAHAEAWKATAAYKLLNETSAGALIEDLAGQVLDRLISSRGRKLSGGEAVAAIKHILQNGFVLGMNAGPASGSGHAVLVLRNAAKTKDLRGLFGRVLGALNGPKAKLSVATKPGGRSIVVVNDPTTKKDWAWWPEKINGAFADVVIALDSAAGADAIIATIDGQRPNAVEDPRRTGLLEEAHGFRPVGFGFIDVDAFPPRAAAIDNVFSKQLDIRGVKHVDLRWGFQDNALMTVLRVTAPRPRQGALAILDGPAFDLKTLPPLPAEIDSLSVLSIDLKGLYDRIAALAARGPAGAAFKEIEGYIQERSHLRLRDDVFGRLGPKLAFYTVPVPTPAPRASTPAGPGAAANPLAALGGLMGGGLPKLVGLFEMERPSTFGRVLDQLVNLANQALEEAFAEDEGDKGEGNEGSRPPGGAKKAQPPRFRLTSIQPKTYVLNLPPKYALLFPSLKPTLMMGQKYLVVATAPDAARQALALEAKPDGQWAPSSELAAAIEPLPAGLKALHVDDPSDTLPAQIVNLPITIQAALNLLAAGPGGLAGPGGPGPQRGASVGGDVLGAAPGGMAPSVKVDPAKLPKADALKGYLFPATSALAVEDQAIHLVMRRPFFGFALLNFISGYNQGLQFGRRLSSGGAPGGGPPNGGTPGSGPDRPEDRGSRPERPVGR
ncbi:MAG: hypothetical protein IRY99_21755, partial [Isosphaeraceae bacterium]|nr:hypothetical protein [Isosphaeraceae bacterium]